MRSKNMCFLRVGSRKGHSRNSRRYMVLFRVESVLRVFKPRFFWESCQGAASALLRITQLVSRPSSILRVWSERKPHCSDKPTLPLSSAPSCPSHLHPQKQKQNKNPTISRSATLCFLTSRNKNPVFEWSGIALPCILTRKRINNCCFSNVFGRPPP